MRNFVESSTLDVEVSMDYTEPGFESIQLVGLGKADGIDVFDDETDEIIESQTYDENADPCYAVITYNPATAESLGMIITPETYEQLSMMLDDVKQAVTITTALLNRINLEGEQIIAILIDMDEEDSLKTIIRWRSKSDQSMQRLELDSSDEAFVLYVGLWLMNHRPALLANRAMTYDDSPLRQRLRSMPVTDFGHYRLH